MCYLFVVSYCKPLPLGKNPFAVNKYYITLHVLTYFNRLLKIISVIVNMLLMICGYKAVVSFWKRTQIIEFRLREVQLRVWSMIVSAGSAP
jgi:uncharacterized iron-regulated membrane protein